MADTFALDIRKFAERAKGNVTTVVQKASGEIAVSVVMRSPVGDPDNWKNPPPPGYVGGRFRANWNVGLGGADLSMTFDHDASGASTIARAQAEIGRWQAGDIFITNSLPYGPALEYEGHSSQAPQGMVRITVAEWQLYVQKAANEVPK